MLIFCGFIRVYVFTTNHHLKLFETINIDFRNQTFPLYEFEVASHLDRE